MIDATFFAKQFEFFAGVPDSQLRALCDCLTQVYGVGGRHIIAANEGNAVGLAAGYYLATGKVPLVYLQNSGIGNIINPVASLLNERVYGIPCVFVVGWRGEPGVHDEPQHAYQGMVTEKLLNDMEIETFVLDQTTREEDVRAKLDAWRPRLEAGRSVAFVVKKGALFYDHKAIYQNDSALTREEAIECLTRVSGEDVIVSTTGKASRELFEIRERNGQPHGRDFLCVGSMGHASSIALSIALQKPKTKVWCLDGDGAALMHMGALAVIGANRPQNLIHVVINNRAHDSVGGMPTVAGTADIVAVAKACGYERCERVSDAQSLLNALRCARETPRLTLLEVMAAIGSRENLGRPTTTPEDNKRAFMAFLKNNE